MKCERGDLVVNKNDPRHVGVVRRTNTNGRRCYAYVYWYGTDRKEFRIPVGDLRLAPKYAVQDAIAWLRKRLLETQLH